VSTLSFILLAFGAAAATGGVALREHRSLRAQRRHLLDGCRDVIKDAEISHGGDSYPWMRGHYGAHPIRVELIPDTMTIRRLPQLWLSLTLLDRLPIKNGFAVLVRPSGYDFYSLTERFTHWVSPPASFPWEVLIRGSDSRCGTLVQRLAKPIAKILSDPRVKEVAVTALGLRIVWQAGEGRRGEHLLLRQAMFDNANVAAEDLAALLNALDGLRTQIIRIALEPTTA
jgi:hypothetical protein